MKYQLRVPSRIILAAIAFLMALALRGFAAPDIAPKRVPAAAIDPWLLGRPDTQKSRVEDTFPPTWRAIRFDANTTTFLLLKPDPAGLKLDVTPRVGLAPLAVSIRLRLPAPKIDDRELELTVWDASSEDMAFPLFRSTRDIYWRTTRILRSAQIAPGQPDTFESVPQTLQASWRLPAGPMLVVGCVWPRSACTSVRVEVS